MGFDQAFGSIRPRPPDGARQLAPEQGADDLRVTRRRAARHGPTSPRSGTRSSSEPIGSRPTPPPGRSTTSTRVAATSSTASRRRSSFATASPVRWSRSAAALPCSTG